MWIITAPPVLCPWSSSVSSSVVCAADAELFSNYELTVSYLWASKVFLRVHSYADLPVFDIAEALTSFLRRRLLRVPCVMSVEVTEYSWTHTLFINRQSDLVASGYLAFRRISQGSRHRNWLHPVVANVTTFCAGWCVVKSSSGKEVCGLSVLAAPEIPVFTQGCKFCIGDILYRCIRPCAPEKYGWVPSSDRRKYGCVWKFVAFGKLQVAS